MLAFILAGMALPTALSGARKIGKLYLAFDFLYSKFMSNEAEKNYEQDVNPERLRQAYSKQDSFVKSAVRAGFQKEMVESMMQEEPYHRLDVMILSKESIEEMGKELGASLESIESLIPKASGTYCLFRTERFSLMSMMVSHLREEDYPDDFEHLLTISKKRASDPRWKVQTEVGNADQAQQDTM